jgi:L-seryl-tRNA(Ser) seleniumtransferase
MMALALDEIERRAEALAAALSNAGLQTEIVDGFSTIGGGSAPGSQLSTRLVALTLPAARLDAALRAARPPVIARIEDGRIVIDLRTVAPEDDERLPGLIAGAAAMLFP